MKITVYDQIAFKNAPIQTARTRIPTTMKQTQGEVNLFQQLLQVEKTQPSNNMEAKFTLPPVEEKIVSTSTEADHDDITTMSWQDILFSLLPTDMSQTFREQFEMNPASIDQQKMSTIKQMVVELMAVAQHNGAQESEQMQQFILPRKNSDGTGQMFDIRSLLAVLEKQKVHQANVVSPASAKRSGSAPIRNFSQVRNQPIAFAQPMPSQFYKLLVDSKNASLTQTAEVSNQKQLYTEVTNQPFLNGFDLTSLPQQKTPVLSLQEIGTTRNINEQLVHQFADIIKSSKFTKLGNGQLQLVIRLHPEHLGTLTVKLVQEKGEMVAKIIASSASAKELVEANIQQISHVIPTQHITIEQFDVRNHEGMPPYEQAFGKHQRNRGGQQQQEQRQQFEREREFHFEDSLMNELLNIEV